MELSKKDIDFLVSILKKYIDTSLATITNKGRVKVHHFEEQYMRTVNGGLPLDQSLFRTYLQTCGKVNVWIDSDKTGVLPADGDQDVLYFLWIDGSYVMYIYTDTYVLITTTTQIDDLHVSGTTTYSSQKIISLIVTSCLGMSYNNLISGLQSTNAQDAIDELKFLIDSVKPTADIVSGHTEDIENLETNKADKSTTLGGYGIIDAYTQTEVNTKLDNIEHDNTLNKNSNPNFLHATQAQQDRWTNNYTYKIEDTSVTTWSASTKYANFGYQAQINIANLTEDDFVNVVFSVTDANSGNYAAAVEQYAGYILIFASVNTAITIPTIVVNKIDL